MKPIILSFVAVALLAQGPQPFAPLDNLPVSCWGVGAIPMVLPNDFTGMKCVPIGNGITITLDANGNAVIVPVVTAPPTAPTPAARLSRTENFVIEANTSSTLHLPVGTTKLDTVFRNGEEHDCVPADTPTCLSDFYRYNDGLVKLTTPLTEGDYLTIQAR